MSQASSPTTTPHAFSYNGQWYLVDPHRFVSAPVTPTVGHNFRQREGDPAMPLLPESEAVLHELKWGETTSNVRRSKKPARPGEETPIVSINLFIAQQCTMNCIYCYGGGGEYGDPGFMEEATAFRAVDWMWRQRGPAKKLSITFFGGEPLLRFDLMKETVTYARRVEKTGDARFHFGVGTNATLITDEIIHYLKENDFGINVGFDGPKDIQDRNRPLRNHGSSYDAVAPRIREMIAAMPQHVSLRATLWRKGDVGRVRQALADFNPSQYQTQPASPGGHCGQSGQIPTADAEDTVQGVREVVEPFIQAVRERDLSLLASIHTWVNFTWMLRVLEPLKGRPQMCRLAQTMVAVSTAGDIYPCHRFVGWEENRIGNVFEGTLDRSMYCHMTFPENSKCMACWARQACNGGCPFDNQVRTGDRFTPSDHYCVMIRSLIETAIHLKHSLTEDDQAFLREKKLLPPRFCPLDLF